MLRNTYIISIPKVGIWLGTMSGICKQELTDAFTDDKDSKYYVYVVTAPKSPDTGFNVMDEGRFIGYHAGGADLKNSLKPESGVPRFADAVLSEPWRTAIILVKEVREKDGYVVIEGSGPVVRVVGDGSQGFYTPYGPDIADVAMAFVNNRLWGLKIFDNYDVKNGRKPLLGTLLAHHVVIAEQYHGRHTVLDHITNRDNQDTGQEDAPYGVLIYAKDVIGRRTVSLAGLVSFIETKQTPQKLASVFRVIRPLKKKYSLNELRELFEKCLRA